MKKAVLLSVAAALVLPAVMLAQDKPDPASPQQSSDSEAEPPAHAEGPNAEIEPIRLPWKCKPIVPKPSKEFDTMTEFFMRNLNIKDISRILAAADIPFTGLMLGRLTKSITEYGGRDGTSGALVEEVLPDSPASRSGLQEGDIVIALNGKAPENADSEKALQELVSILGKLRVGQAVSISVLREGSEKEVSLTVGKHDNTSLSAPSHTEMSFDKVQEFSTLEKILRDNAIFDVFLQTASQMTGAGNLILNKTRVSNENLANVFRIGEVTYCLKYPLNTVLVSQQVSDRLRQYANRSNQNLHYLIRECAALLDLETPGWERYRDNGFMPSTMLSNFVSAATELDSAFSRTG